MKPGKNELSSVSNPNRVGANNVTVGLNPHHARRELRHLVQRDVAQRDVAQRDVQ